MKGLWCAAVVLLVFSGDAFAQRTSVARDFPVYENGLLPDLTVDPKRFVSQMEIVDRYFDPASDPCVYAEGAINTPDAGYRRLLRFDTVIMNSGGGDLVVGDRSDPDNPYATFFYFSPCHGHYHIRDFSEYELVATDGQTVVTGRKQGFCFEDSFKYENGKSNGYECEHQGITSGWGDWYYKQLVGQWIDITGVPEGDYLVRVTINKGTAAEGPLFDEGENRYPNVITTPIHIPDPRKKVSVVAD